MLLEQHGGPCTPVGAQPLYAGCLRSSERHGRFVHFHYRPIKVQSCGAWSTNCNRPILVQGKSNAPGAITAFAPILTLSPTSAPNLSTPVLTILASTEIRISLSVRSLR